MTVSGMTGSAAIAATRPFDLQGGALPGRMLRTDLGLSGESETWLDRADPIFSVHFPEWPVLPGSFVLRIALATAAAVEAVEHWKLSQLKRITFRQGARPGQTLQIKVARAVSQSDDLAIDLKRTYTFVATTGSTRISDGEFTIVPVVCE